jgi:hypothetical protein
MLGLRATLELPSYSDLGSPKKRHHPGSGGGHLGEALATCAVLLLACAVVGMQLVAARTQLAHLSARTDQLESQLLYEKVRGELGAGTSCARRGGGCPG